MQNESKRAGGKPSKWYFNLTTNESGAIEEYRRHFADPAISAI